MKKTSKGTSKSTQVRNLVRGALSIAKAPSIPTAKRNKGVQGKWHQEQLAHQQINKAITLAKKPGTTIEVNAFNEWVSKSSAAVKLRTKRLGRPLTSLGLLPTNLNSRNLVSELGIANKHLLKIRPQLAGLRGDLANIQQSFLRKDWPCAQHVVDKVVQEHGYSYWAIELKIALTQASSGIEGMKSIVTSIAAKTALGSNRFFLHYFGVRNEPAQAPSRFKESIKKRLEDAELEDGIKTYFGYRLTGDLMLDEKQLACVLAADELISDIDLFFTSIKVVLWIQRNESNFSRTVLNEAIALASVLSYIVPMPNTSVAAQPRMILEQAEANKAALLKHYIASPADLLALARVSIDQLLSPTDLIPLVGEQTMIATLVDGIASKLSTRSDGVAAEDLAKLQLNFNTMPVLLPLGDIADLPYFPVLLMDAQNGAPCDPQPLSLGHALRHYVAGTLNSSQCFQPDDSRETINTLTLAAAAYGAGDVEPAQKLLFESRGRHDNEVIADALLVVAAWRQYGFDEYKGALTTIARAGLRNDRLTPILPLCRIFQGARWKALRDLGPSVELSICLDFYLRAFDDGKVRSYKRYAIEELMVRYSSESLLTLLEHLVNESTEVAQLQYLFHSVCDIYTMELLPGMGDSKRVRQQRVSLLKRLAAVCPSNEMEYLSEAQEIEEYLSVNDGLEALDDSRVYVDEPRLLNAINQEIAGDFQRYLNLVEAGIGVSDSFSEVLRSLKKPSAKNFQMPKNDADDLFGDIVSQIREKFLFDPAYGLDIHISRRIRHGTIASQIRGPLEAAGLIGQRPTAGANYAPPDAIASLTAQLDGKMRVRVNAAFSRFADALDQHIGLLRDEYFHVVSKGKPRGLFDVPITPIVLGLCRSLAQESSSISEFSKECIGVFWLFLSQRMAAKQRPIEQECKKTLNSVFEKLTQELKSSGIDNGELFSRIQQASEDIRNRIPIIISWIRVPKFSVEGKTYSMQKVVDISVASVMAQRPGFKPIVSSSVPSDVELDNYGISVVADTLYIALGNVYQHSGKRVDNRVNIDITFNREASLFSFSVLSEIAHDTRTPEKETRLQSIRAKIAKRTYGDARTDTGSGLIKLAALVLQSRVARIDFDFEGNSYFKLEFDLDYASSGDGSKYVSESGDLRYLDSDQGIDHTHDNEPTNEDSSEPDKKEVASI